MLLFRPLITFLLLLRDSLMLRTLVAKLLGLLLLRVLRRWDSEYALANVIRRFWDSLRTLRLSDATNVSTEWAPEFASRGDDRRTCHWSREFRASFIAWVRNTYWTFNMILRFETHAEQEWNSDNTIQLPHLGLPRSAASIMQCYRRPYCSLILEYRRANDLNGLNHHYHIAHESMIRCCDTCETVPISCAREFPSTTTSSVYTSAKSVGCTPWRQTAPDAGTATVRLSGSQRGLEGLWGWRQTTMDCEYVGHDVWSKRPTPGDSQGSTCICACRIATTWLYDDVQKYLTTVICVMILNYAVGLDVAGDVTQSNTQGVWPCILPIDSLPPYLLVKCLNSCSTSLNVNSLAETFRVRLQGSQMKILLRNKCFYHHPLASHIPPVTVIFGVLRKSEKVTTPWDWFESTISVRIWWHDMKMWKSCNQK